MGRNNPSNKDLVNVLAMGAGTLGDKIVEIGTSMARADQQLQIDHLQNFVQPLLEAPNVVFDQIEAMPGDFDDLVRHSETPAIAVVNGERLAFQKARFEFDMSIGSHTEVRSENDIRIKSQTDIEAGWGPVKVKQSITADVSHKDSQVRTTDMTARLHMEAEVGREPIAEGLAKAIDASNEFSRVANQLRLQVAGAKVAQMQQQIAEGDIPEEATALPAADDGASKPAPRAKKEKK